MLGNKRFFFDCALRVVGLKKTLLTFIYQAWSVSLVVFILVVKTRGTDQISLKGFKTQFVKLGVVKPGPLLTPKLWAFTPTYVLCFFQFWW